MKTLSALLERESFEVPPFALDHFQKKVREGLHLEFFLARGRLILTPHLAPLTTAGATAAEEAQVSAILEDRQELLEQVKLYLLFNLSLYSALLETNSHHVALNDHRVISRFLPYGPGACEVKLYTQPPGDPVERYGDRIYLGRDCLPLDSPRRVRELFDTVRSPALKFNSDPVNFVGTVRDAHDTLAKLNADRPAE